MVRKRRATKNFVKIRSPERETKNCDDFFVASPRRASRTTSSSRLEIVTIFRFQINVLYEVSDLQQKIDPKRYELALARVNSREIGREARTG